jgi:1D-myo-inositol 3-kinase
VLGGTVSYAAVTASALGHDTGILTSASASCDLSVLRDRVDVVRIPADSTTTFENQYWDGNRTQVAYAFAEPITAAHLPHAWREPTIAHIGPILHECLPDLQGAFGPNTFLGVTPQGWLRVRDASGRIHPREWKGAGNWLARASAVVLSLEDVGHNWSLIDTYAQQTELLVVTQGWLGGVLFESGRSSNFSAPTVQEVDPTGAGDIFATCFFTQVAAGHAPDVAVRFASCVAAHSVSRRGLASMPRSDEIRICAETWS